MTVPPSQGVLGVPHAFARCLAAGELEVERFAATAINSTSIQRSLDFACYLEAERRKFDVHIRLPDCPREKLNPQRLKVNSDALSIAIKTT